MSLLQDAPPSSPPDGPDVWRGDDPPERQDQVRPHPGRGPPTCRQPPASRHLPWHPLRGSPPGQPAVHAPRDGVPVEGDLAGGQVRPGLPAAAAGADQQDRLPRLPVRGTTGGREAECSPAPGSV